MSLKILQLIAIQLSAVLTTTTPMQAENDLSQRVEAPHVTVSLLGEPTHIQPGVSFTVGLQFEMANNWHIYWRNPGDSGLEPRVTWQLPDGFEATSLRWPAPSRIHAQHLVNFGYERQVILLAVLTPPVDLPIGGEVHLLVNVDWLVCKQVCIPGSAQLQLVLPVAVSQVIDFQIKTRFNLYRRRLPAATADLGWQVSAQLLDQTLQIAMTPPTDQATLPRSVVFFPYACGFIDNGGEQVLERHPMSLVLRVALQPESVTDRPSHVQGVLVADGDKWSHSDSGPAMRIDVQLTPPLP